jgi:serine/threonine-protein kinase
MDATAPGPGSIDAMAIDELAEEFLARRRRGERPTIDEYVARYPELAEGIRAVFPAIALVDDVGPATEPDGGPPSAPAAGPEQVGDYRIVREIGRGGMGVVYEAEQVSLGRRVALKLLPAGALAGPKYRGRFEREARAAARLHHTNIVPVFGVGEHEGSPYYVMQLIEGRGLDAVIRELRREAAPRPATVDTDAPAEETRDVEAEDVARSLLDGRYAGTTGAGTPATADDPTSDNLTAPAGPEAPAAVVAAPTRAAAAPSPSSSLLLGAGPSGPGRQRARAFWLAVARLGAQVGNALAYAHAQGIVHRDIKPSNLLIDAHGSAWVADFGLAKADDAPNLTETGDVLGTLRYMPPEAFEGKSGPRADLYSLGLTLYELIALRPAFDEPDRAHLIRAVTEGEPPRLRQVRPDVPRDLETIVQKAIERDPSHRYASAAELVEDLERFLDDRPIAARRVTEAEKLWRWCRRNPLPAGLAAAFVLALVAGAAASSYYAIRERRANTELRAANAREREQFELAMDAIRDSHERITGDVLMKQAEFSGLRDKLLASSRDFYRKLEASLAGKTDRRSRAALGRAYHALGELMEKTGSKEEAIAAYEHAAEVRRALAGEAGADAEAHSDLGHSLLVLAGMREEQVGQRGQVGPTVAEAQAQLEAAARERPGDPRVRLDRGRCLLFQATGQELAGQLEAARATRASGLEALRALLDDHPDERDARVALANALMDMGSQARVAGRADEALNFFEQARTVFEAYARTHPEDMEFQLGVGTTYNDAGIVLGDELARTAEARAAFERYRDILAPIAEANPGVLMFVTGLSVARYNIGRMLWNDERLEEALAAMAAVRGGNEALARAHPNDGTFRYFLWIQNWHISEILGRLGRLPEALAAARRSLEVAEATAASQPSEVGLRIWVANSSQAVGGILGRMGRHAEALSYLERVRGGFETYLERYPNDPLVTEALLRGLADLIEARRRIGRADQAAALSREAGDRLQAYEHRSDLKPSELYAIACVRSRLSATAPPPGLPPSGAGPRGGTEGDRAVGVLRRAIAAGYRRLDAMRKDRDLDPLRGRSDFQVLMMDLAFPAEPFAP